jgi:hypothetical protein
MGNLPPTAFDMLMHQLSVLPLWVKQVIYAQLRRELEAALSKTTLEAFGADHTLQLWIPEISRQGILELERPTGQLPQMVLRVLHLARNHKSVMSITIMNNWSLEHCAAFLTQAIEKTLLLPPKSHIVQGTIDYLAGRTRLGEYLVKINRLSLAQLDQALRTQKAIEEAMGAKTGLANVLINLGYIKKEDSEAILFLKEESRRVLDVADLTLGGGSPEVVNRLNSQLQQAIQRIRELEAVNAHLRSSLSQARPPQA